MSSEPDVKEKKQGTYQQSDKTARIENGIVRGVSVQIAVHIMIHIQMSGKVTLNWMTPVLQTNQKWNGIH